MPQTQPPMLVDIDWLQSHLHDPNVRVLDCTTYMVAQPVGPSQIHSGRPEFDQSHIPGACHVDMVQDLSDPDGRYPYTLLSPEQFQALASRLGLHPDDHVILYTNSSIVTLTRAWWVFYVMGQRKLSILNGNLKEWQRQGGEVTQEVQSIRPSQYPLPKPLTAHIAHMHDIQEALQSESDPKTLLNALAPEQFQGTGGAHYGRPGRIPDSLSLPARSLADAETGKFLPTQTLKQMVIDAGIEPDVKVIHYCGGGIAASTTAFVLSMLGWKNWALYDNSLLEWSTQNDTPMIVG